MIIDWIKARNFMRFEEVAITDIPESGCIAIAGDNESGKSAIGEIISFALFGETPRASGAAAFRVVRWGSRDMSAKIGFRVPGMGGYVVERQIDQDGMTSARLSAAGGEVIAEGKDAVALEIRNLVCFDYDEFRYSFYLAQNELDVVEGGPGSGAREVIFKMLGIDILDRVRLEASAELYSMKESHLSAARELSLIRALLENFDYDPDETQKLSRQSSELAVERESLYETTGEITEELRRHSESLEEHVLAFEAVDRLGREILRDGIRGRLISTLGQAGGTFRMLKETQESLLETREKAAAESAKLDEKLARLGRFNENLTVLGNLIRMQIDRRKADLSEEPLTAGTSLRAMCSSMESDLAKTRIAFALGVMETLIAAGLGAAFLAAFHSAASGREYLPFLRGVIDDGARPAAAALCAAAFIFLALVLAVKAGIQRRANLRRSSSLSKARAQLKTAEVEGEALSRIDLSDVRTVRSAQSQIAEPGIREMMRRIVEEFGDLMDAGGAPGPEIEKLEQSAMSMRSEIRRAEAASSHRQRIIDYAERRSLAMTEGMPELSDAWTGAAPRKSEEQIEEIENALYSLFDRIQMLRTFYINECGGPAGESAPPMRKWEAVKSRLADLSALLTETTGYQGSLNSVRFENFIERGEWDSPSQLAARLGEEIARIKTAFPTEEEIRKKIRKLRDDLERANGKIIGVDSRLEAVRREIERLKAKHDRFAQLKEKEQSLAKSLGPIEYDIDVRSALIELLSGTADNIKNRLGPEIGKFVGGALSEMTRGRYGDASVSEDLEIRIFSREKNGLISLDEVSGGTKDQVLLCLRLALAQALVRARMNADRIQFLFLDEPVSSFDEERCEAFLGLVGGFSPNLKQVFVTLHATNPAEGKYDRLIRTDPAKIVLSASLL